jgi:hypothetical protein
MPVLLGKVSIKPLTSLKKATVGRLVVANLSIFGMTTGFFGRMVIESLLPTMAKLTSTK